QGRRLESGEREIVASLGVTEVLLLRESTWELHGIPVAGGSGTIEQAEGGLRDVRAAGIVEPQQACGLVEGLACGIVDGGAEEFDVVDDISDAQNLSVPARDEQSDGRRGQSVDILGDEVDGHMRGAR